MPNHKPYATGNPKIDKLIDELAKDFSTPQTRSYIHDLFTTVIKLHQDKADEHDLYLINNTLKELRHIFRTFAPYREIKKVALFGSHRSPAEDKEYLLAEEFSRLIAAQGFMVITGGGGGVMEAANKGAGKSGFAVKIKLPLEQKVNPYVIPGEKLINVKYFYTRKLAFIKESDATVLFPGGFGTHDEGFEVLTLAQTGKATPRPIVMVEAPGRKYWKNWLRFIEEGLVKGKFIRPVDRSLFKIVSSAKAAAQEVIDFYRLYHSIRYGRETTIIRLQKPLSEKYLAKLSKKYADIIAGQINPSGPLPVEVREKDHLHLPRICFCFDRHGFARLAQLIRDLNQA
ncbi:TIGR00730 family Rossman fold protein [Candidatus Saganbacteria bacterium CG08_land_8_20_14_0_20_45_16]|uniref:TIGR00730 family Rossman fold protein n=1 Tax=Candidatus Saganbacteria bacterium CG08_land_8_20_14_0_20_45_16 TaxID=2014293 RepID=A0A2H0XWU1_UNCSA|nr:MAG: TIGR00730 family Rossman fold protein [Candidatus Saganbacteria bacterium CG08_land_8_20_14_0_20_45_16]